MNTEQNKTRKQNQTGTDKGAYTGRQDKGSR